MLSRIRLFADGVFKFLRAAVCGRKCNIRVHNSLFSSPQTLQLAEYRQRKAYADSQKKQKKKKKKKEESEGDSQGKVEVEPDRSVGGEEGPGGGRDGAQEGKMEPPTTEFTFGRTLCSGETVKHDQTYTIEVDTPPTHLTVGF